MKNFFKKNQTERSSFVVSILSLVFLLTLSFSPIYVRAASTGCTGSTAASGYLPNPLCVGSINDILYLAVDIATYIGVVLAFVFIIYAGLKYILARGNSEKISEAHRFLFAVIIGIAILIGAEAIVNVIKNTLTSAGVVSSNTFNAPTQTSNTSANTITNTTSFSAPSTNNSASQPTVPAAATPAPSQTQPQPQIQAPTTLQQSQQSQIGAANQGTPDNGSGVLSGQGGF